jgi:hypothetical protein
LTACSFFTNTEKKVTNQKITGFSSSSDDKATRSNQKLDSLEDMKKFVKNYAEYKMLSANAARHIATLVELNKLVDSRNLLGDDGIAVLELGILNGLGASNALKRVKEAIGKGGSARTDIDKVVQTASILEYSIY